MALHGAKLAWIAAVSLFGLGFAAEPASAWGWGPNWGCGFSPCAAQTIVIPAPQVYQTCSCCGCGTSSYYGGYAPSYGYGATYATGDGFGYGYGYGYAGYYGSGVYGGYGGWGDAYYRPRPYLGWGGGFYRPRVFGGYGRVYGARYVGGFRGAWRRGY